MVVGEEALAVPAGNPNVPEHIGAFAEYAALTIAPQRKVINLHSLSNLYISLSDELLYALGTTAFSERAANPPRG